jgi:cytochrome c
MRSIEQKKSQNVRRLQCQMALAICAAVLQLSACGQNDAHPGAEYSGDVQNGLLIIERSGCGSCHHISGVPNSDGLVGPPLDHFAKRTMVAGLLPNTPDHLIRWLRFPQSVVPGNVMPDMGLTEDQARDVAAYLYSLK